MSPKILSHIAARTLLAATLLLLPIVRSTLEIPADKAQIADWFAKEVGVTDAPKFVIEEVVATANKAPKVINVNPDGSGQFKTINDALSSIPDENKNRVILKIGPGNYTEKIKIERYKSFITMYGDPNNMPTLIFNGNAAKYGTTDSGTLTVESDYFTAVNLKIVNSSPRPDGKMEGAQAAALDISGDYASFYNCKIYGFQDTLLDDRGRHLFKDCYVEGTVDFICGGGQSIYLNTTIHVIPGDPMAIITAHSRNKPEDTCGYIFAHCSITGSGGNAFLGRAWFDHPRVIFAYCDMSDVIDPKGWYENQPKAVRTEYFGEFNNKGPGADLAGRVPFIKKMTPEDAKPYVTLEYIQASKWLLPPPSVQSQPQPA